MLRTAHLEIEWECNRYQGIVAEKNLCPWEHECLILIKYLEYVVQNSYDNAGLEAGVGHVVAFVRSHYGWPT